MKVVDAMTRSLDFVDPSANVQEAATRMAELDVGAIIVGSVDAIEGILTDRDIIVRVVVEGKHPADTQVRDVMTSEVVSCRLEDAVEDAFAAMREEQIRRMPVLDENGKPTGIVTLSDLAKHIESPEKVAEKLREISEPHRSREEPEEKTPGPAEETNEAAAEGETEKPAA